MKRLLLLALIFSFAFQPVLAEYVDLSLTYPETIEKGEEVRITFEIINQSNDRLWDGKITIEESFMDAYGRYIQSERDYQNNPIKFSIIESGDRFKETFVLTFKEDIPLNEVRFDILLKCGKGQCKGGCMPFFLEKTVYIKLTEKKAEAVLRFDTNEFTTYSGETLEIPFTLENIGKLQMKDITVEIKGDVVSDEIVKISYLNPEQETSKNILVSIDENTSKTSLNSIVVVRFADTLGKEGMTYKSILIKVIEKENIQEPDTPEVNDGIIEETQSKTSSLVYFFVILSIVAIIAVIVFLKYLFKR